MAPKKSKKEKNAESSGKKKKKAKLGLKSQESKKDSKATKGRAEKRWGKNKGKNEDADGDNGATGVRCGLKPVRVKLDKEGHDTIIDILHQLHVAGAGDSAQDDDDDDETDSEDEAEEWRSGSSESEEESEDASVEVDDSDDDEFAGKRGHGDFEYDGTFGDMANLMSDLVVNEAALSTGGNGDRGKTTAEKGASRAITDGSGEAVGATPASRKNGSPPAATAGKKQQSQERNPLLGGNGTAGGSRAKEALRSNVAREKFLASMVQEDRKVSREEQWGKGGGGMPISAAIAMASSIGGGTVSAAAAARGYRRPDPPGAGKGNDKVRLEVCGENKKTGTPDLNGKKMLVFDRKQSFQKVLDTCKGKLHIKKKAKGAALLDGEEVVDWLTDLSWVPNGAVVLISCVGPGGPKKGKPPAGASSDSNRGSPAVSASVGGHGVVAPGQEGTVDAGAEKEAGENDEDDEEEEEETLALAALSRIRESYKTRARGRQSEAAKGSGGAAEEEAGQRMIEKRRAAEKTASFRQMMAQRRGLPAYVQQEDIVKTIRDNQVVVLSGETGCGKTTQVPQFVLDSLIDRGQGGKCNIVCTQPRRISAVGVAERVASERCERVGDTVGYQIRLESRVGASTRLTFCTTGILLRRLTSDDTLAGVSHIMVDEVHERDLQTDFLLVILRDLLPKRPDLRVVLMSATLQADLFTKYFSECPAITIPGRTFPVEITYMDDVNRLVRGSKAPALMPRVSSGPGVLAGRANSGRGNGAQGSRDAGTPGGRSQGRMGAGTERGQQQNRQQQGDDEDVSSMLYDPLTGEPLELDGDSKAADGIDASTAMVSPKCEDKVDYDIMVELVDYIMRTESGGTVVEERGKGGWGGRQGSGANDRSRGGNGNGNGSGRGRGEINTNDSRSHMNNGGRGRGGRDAGGVAAADGEPLGAILVFLPGFAEIDQLVKALERHPRIGRGSRVFPLHSSLPSHQQKFIFKRMPPGVRKIVVSTNIAETSVTIDDCTHVIDAGRVREMRYDPITRMSCLVEVWISKASGSQRAGRAGRVRPGKCWRLYPQAFHESFMPPHTLAEMLRTPLEELVLQVLLLELGSPADFLGRAVEPPPAKMLRAALRNLHDLQAIILVKGRAILTPLGYHLAHLPMDARVGKLLLIAAILQCLDPILTIAAALSDKAPFQRPFGEQGRADAARQQFAQHKSDHMAIVEAFSAWRNKRRSGSYDEVRRWCRENFLSHPTLERLDSLREQFRQQLAEVGFTSSAVPSRRAAGRDAALGEGASRWRRDGEGSRGPAVVWGEDGGTGPQDPDRNAGNIALVQSILCAGLYPHVAAFVRPDPRRQIKKGHFVTRDDAEPVFLHPSSVNHKRFSAAAGSGRQVWVMYHSKMKTKQVYLHDSTYATPFSLMLWGAHVRHERPLGRTKKKEVEVVIDRWLRFRMTESAAVAFKAMRRELSNLLVGKIEAPHADTGPLSGMLVACLGRLLDIEARNPC